MAIAVRAVSFGYVNNTNTKTVALPAGTAAGDTLVVFGVHGYQVNTPTGFDASLSTNVGNYNGGTYMKVPVTAADVTAGSVTVTFAGSYYGHVIIVAFTGAILGVSAKIQGSSAGGAASRTLTTGTQPLVGDYVLYLGAGRVNAAITSSAGSVALANDAQNQSSFVLTGDLVTVAGAQSSTFSYPTIPTGEYQAIFVISEVNGPFAQVMDDYVEVLQGGAGSAQVMDVYTEVVRNGNPSAQMMDVGVEVLRTLTTVLRRRINFITMEAIPPNANIYPANALTIDGDYLLVDGNSVEF
jgi:hypothetical protein